MGTHEVLWSDPLSNQGDRFPLGPPPEYWSECHDTPSAVGLRPFSLRGVVPVPTSDARSSVIYSYDPVRQIGLVHDQNGEAVPLAGHTRPGATPPETSGYRDGDPKNPPPEELTAPDYQDD